jgi:FtsP/CotA-like multicopper oxidase with cupredoxin domain
MTKNKFLVLTCLALVMTALSGGINQAVAQTVQTCPAGYTVSALRADVNYCVPNFANSPIIPKFVESLPLLGPGGASTPALGNYIPVATAETTLPAGVPNDAAYYEIALVEYMQQLHPSLGATKLRGYVQIVPPGRTPLPAGAVALTYISGSKNGLAITVTVNGVATPVYGYDKPRYLGPVISATKDTPTRIKFYNLLPLDADGGKLFIPTDVTVDGAGTGPNSANYTQNRATLHLHGGDNPWISDGTAHQWITPAGEAGTLLKGASQQNVPDMPLPTTGDGTATFYWPNGQSGRLMFYHDHAFGITRLNVYAGEAAGYLLTDTFERGLNSFAPGGEIPLVIQDKSFVNTGTIPAGFTGTPTAPTTTVDPLWAWGQTAGSLWMPHVYVPNQNPSNQSGANPFGRWDYGAWFWPVFPSLIPPQNSIVPEIFMDTPLVNGMAYPVLNVDPTTYRFRILNAANDRFMNLQLYVATPIISGISVLTGGSGYTLPPNVIITPAAGDTTGMGATAEAIIDAAGVVTAFNMLTVGSGYTAQPSVAITPAFGETGTVTAATASANLYTALTEVGMLPAVKTYPAAWPSWWMANDTPGMIPNVLDGRQGGVPDPRTMGPSFVMIGSEGGISPAATVLQNTPMGYEQNKRSVTVLNTVEHTLFLGPAERADVMVDFSQALATCTTLGVTPCTLILYNDAPAPVPAGDPRYAYYTAGPDMTSQGGAPPTQAGFGPNIRTIMKINVAAKSGTPLIVGALNTAVASAFTASGQSAPIVPLGTYANIQDTSMTATFNINGVPTTTTLQMQPKTIQELFDPFGRMNSTLGVEIPFTTATIQTTIPYGFTDPATEVMLDGDTQLWKITHNGVDTHAIHFHLFNVQVVNRVGWDGAIKPPWPEELGWKETVKMNPLEDIVVALRAKTPPVPATMASKIPNNVRFLDPTKPANFQFTGVVDPNNNPVAPYLNKAVNFGHEYTWHCHLLGHEENDMMRPIMVAVKPLSPTLLPYVVSKGNLILSWTDPTPDETAYMVQKRTTANPTWATIATVPAGTNTYTDTTWKSNQGAQYQVIAVNTVGSGVLGFPSVTAYSLPSNVQAAPLGVTTITSVTQALAVASPVVVKWTYSATDQTGFRIERSTSNTFPANGTTAFTVAGSVFSFNDATVVTGLKKNTTFFYRVTPTNANGSGAPSSVVSLLVHP